MKTCRNSMAACTAAALMILVANGCGARSVATADQASTANPSESTSVGTVTSTAPVLGETGSVAGAETAAPPVPRSERSLPPLKPEIAEIVRLMDTGAGEEVVRAFVSVSSVPYDLSLEEIVYLRDVGIPDGVIAAMMRRGGELRTQREDAASLQTNLVAAVEQLKDAFSTTERPAEPATPPAAAEVEVAAEAVPSQAPAPPPDAPQPVQQFYSDLAPYGNWYQVPSYGWVWQPSVVVVNPGWAPYRHGGRWLWSDYGWYWCSDYSWGWAPFHYGRWSTYPGLGWCWVPGTVWGPSWVTWRTYGDCVGWAPLPPACGWTAGVGLTWYGSGVSVGFGFGLGASCYTFVPYNNFCHRNVGHHAVKGHDADRIYHNSTVINNVVVGDNNTVVNNGMGYTKVASAFRGEVPKARVEDLPAVADRPLRADRLERSGDGLVVYRPTSVESVGGRPQSLRAEVRPTVESARMSVRPAADSRSGIAGGLGRPTLTGIAPSTAAKPMETRGAVSQLPSPSTPPASVGTRPSAPSRPSLTPAARSAVQSPTAKPVETRTTPTVGRTSPAGRSPTPGYGSGRQTMPVPLADPTRNIPSTLRQPAPRTTIPNAPTKPVIEPRSAPVANPSSSFTPIPRSAPQSVQVPGGSSGVSRPGYTPMARPQPSAPKPTFQRSASPSITMPSAPSAPRSFAPSAPSMPSAPRPSFSAPSPVRSAPSPTMSAPRSVGSAPSAAGATPSAGAGRGRSN